MHSAGLLLAASNTIRSHAPSRLPLQLMADGKSDIRGPAMHLLGFCADLVKRAPKSHSIFDAEVCFTSAGSTSAVAEFM